MILSAACKKFVKMKRASGLKYNAEERFFKQFIDLSGDLSLSEISEDMVASYISSGSANSQTMCRRFFVLRLFFRWCIDRDYIQNMPMRYSLPVSKSDFVPYIYSKDEIRKILREALHCSCASSPLLGETMQALLLTVYSCGLRLCEAITLRICDINFEKNEMFIKESKFRKSRILPFCDQLSSYLITFLNKRKKYLPLPEQDKSAFFCTRTGNKIYGPAVDHLFQRIRNNCQITPVNRRIQPRIHDLRHSFAVHRLYDWYKSNLPVNDLLPHLSTYLGHKDLEDTKVYLTTTSELLHIVSEKFEQHTFSR